MERGSSGMGVECSTTRPVRRKEVIMKLVRPEVVGRWATLCGWQMTTGNWSVRAGSTAQQTCWCLAESPAMTTPSHGPLWMSNVSARRSEAAPTHSRLLTRSCIISTMKREWPIRSDEIKGERPKTGWCHCSLSQYNRILADEYRRHRCSPSDEYIGYVRLFMSFFDRRDNAHRVGKPIRNAICQ